VSVTAPSEDSRLPSPQAALDTRDTDLLRRIGAAGWFVAALVSWAATRLADPDPSDHTGLLICGGVDLAIAVALFLGRRFPRWLVKGLVIYAAVVMTSVVIAFAKPLGPVPLYYIFAAFTSAYFGSRADVVAVCLLVSVTFAIAMTFNDSVQIPGVNFWTTVSVVTLVAVFTRRITERAEALVEELDRAARTDPLTGLPNRRRLQEELPDRIERARRSRLPLSLVIFDLDHFKRLNDRYGHDAGDEALRAFARLLRAESRQGDLVARMGGEEFIAVLQGAGAASARRFAERIGELLREREIADGISVTTSAGVATFDRDAADAESLLIAADRALYAAKTAGRDRVVAAGDPSVRPLSVH